MKKLIIATTILGISLYANNSEELFNTKCAVCHKVEVKDKNSLIAPPINKVMMHVKKSFNDKKEATAFIQEYALNPDPKKTICPSIDIFGVMPTQKGAVTKDELKKISNYIYNNFPNNNMKHKKMNKEHGKGGFMHIDSNGNGFISKNEFNAFRAKKEGINIKKIKYNYFFDKIDRDGDGKLSKNEFMEFKKMVKGN